MHPTKQNRNLKLVAILLIGLAFSLGTFYYLNASQIKANAIKGEKAMDSCLKKLPQELKKINVAVSSLKLLFETADSIDRPLFATFTQPFIEGLPGIRALEWAPNISQEQRTSFVQSIRKEGFKQFKIQKPDSILRIFVTAPIQARYFPVQFISPSKLNRLALGYDLLSSASRKVCIEASERNEKMVVSPPLQLIQNDSNTRSILVVQAVKRDSQTLGVILGVHNVNDFINNILRDELPFLEVVLWDHAKEGQAMYTNLEQGLQQLIRLPSNHTGLGKVHQLQFGGRTWSIYLHPNKHILNYPHLSISYAYLLFGMLITILIITMVYLNSASKLYLEDKVLQRTQALKTANEQQAILLKEIHHRVKNNLQVITSLLSLQSNSIDNPKVHDIFRVSQYRINAMAVLHETLYQSNDLSKIDYAQYLQKLIDYLIVSIKGTKASIQLDLELPEGLMLNIDTAIPLGLLINEIVTNSLKYGFDKSIEAPCISIQIKAESYPDFVLYISDNGKGFSTNITPQTTKSLGLKLIHQLARQLKGNSQRLEKQLGTHYCIHFQEID